MHVLVLQSCVLLAAACLTSSSLTPQVLLPRLRNPHRAGELHAAVAQAHQHELVLAKIVGSTPSKPTTQALKPGSGSRLPKDTAPTKPKRRRN